MLKYRGRFAPSPSGNLHLGSLVCALASYCDAKLNLGQWLIRMEDIDPPREQEGSKKKILDTLQIHGLLTDETISYQSNHSLYYDLAIKQLLDQKDCYYCYCTSKSVKLYHSQKQNCPCRSLTNTIKNKEYSIRIKVDQEPISFNDTICGQIEQNLKLEVGDFVIKRRDGLYAYQLAVVVDDARQNISHIVRGQDLLDVTARQIFLQKKLNLNQPIYSHIPIVYNRYGIKLSKQTFAKELDNSTVKSNLLQACEFLKINVAPNLQIHEIIQQAVLNWSANTTKNYVH